MKRTQRLILSLLSCLCTLGVQGQGFSLGADISWETEMEAKGYNFANAAGEARECTALMKELGLNAVRLRVWVNPADGFCGKQDVLEKAQRAHAQGMDIMIDFHYSDSWADPGQQNIPAAWKSHDYQTMCQDLVEHTKDVLSTLKAAGIPVRWVQVGNETSNGLLWELGRASANEVQYAGFINAGYGAVKEIYPEAAVIVHLDNGWNNDLYKWNLGILHNHGARFDMVGMSLYPYSAVQWNGFATPEAAVESCIENIKWVKTTYQVPTMIVETGMKVAKPAEGKEVLATLLKKAREETQGLCQGVFYWEPEAPSGYNGGYDMGAFAESTGKVCRPTAIMEAFTEAALSAINFPATSTAEAQASIFDLQGKHREMLSRGVNVMSTGRKLLKTSASVQ